MIDFITAQQVILQQARSFGTERITLEMAGGRVLAEPVFADRDYPPFHRVTMDGYAVRWAELEAGVRRFAIIETVFAGAVAGRPASAGECFKIMTGAPLPESVDTVIRREDVVEDGGQLRVPDEALPAEWRAFMNIARRGEDIRSGEAVIKKPALCTPAIVGLLASLGKKELLVQTAPRVAILTTGNEIVPVDAPVQDAQIRNSNYWLLLNLLRSAGVGSITHTHAPDDPEFLQNIIRSFLRSDILVICGGVSAGDADHVPATLEDLGVRCLFHKISMRPGKPVWCGIGPQGTLVFALPGNPVSCLAGFVLLMRPYLQACFGLDIPEPPGIPLAASKRKRTPLDEFFPVYWEGSPIRIYPAPLNGSGDIRLGLNAQALALHPAASGDLEEGTPIACYPI